MRILATISAVMLFLFLLVSAPAFSQEGVDRPDHPQDEKAKDKDKDAKGKADTRQDDKTARPDERRRDESRPDARQQDNRERPEAARPQEQTQPEQRRDEHAGRPQEQTRPEAHGDRQRPAQAQRGQRIPDDRFRASFGREHRFHVDRARIVNQSQPVIVYGGYNFQLVDPWPAEWSYDDDYYIEYVDDQYYLYDAYHPGIRIVVFVVG